MDLGGCQYGMFAVRNFKYLVRQHPHQERQEKDFHFFIPDTFSQWIIVVQTEHLNILNTLYSLP